MTQPFSEQRMIDALTDRLGRTPNNTEKAVAREEAQRRRISEGTIVSDENLYAFVDAALISIEESARGRTEAATEGDQALLEEQEVGRQEPPENPPSGDLIPQDAYEEGQVAAAAAAAAAAASAGRGPEAIAVAVAERVAPAAGYETRIEEVPGRRAGNSGWRRFGYVAATAGLIAALGVAYFIGRGNKGSEQTGRPVAAVPSYNPKPNTKASPKASLEARVSPKASPRASPTPRNYVDAKTLEAQLAAERKAYGDQLTAERKAYGDQLEAERKNYAQQLEIERKAREDALAEKDKQIADTRAEVKSYNPIITGVNNAAAKAQTTADAATKAAEEAKRAAAAAAAQRTAPYAPALPLSENPQFIGLDARMIRLEEEKERRRHVAVGLDAGVMLPLMQGSGQSIDPSISYGVKVIVPVSDKWDLWCRLTQTSYGNTVTDPNGTLEGTFKDNSFSLVPVYNVLSGGKNSLGLGLGLEELWGSGTVTGYVGQRSILDEVAGNDLRLLGVIRYSRDIGKGMKLGLEGQLGNSLDGSGTTQAGASVTWTINFP